MGQYGFSMIFCNNRIFYFFKDFINELLKRNAPIKIKNSEGWTPLEEAISYGDRSTSEPYILWFPRRRLGIRAFTVIFYFLSLVKTLLINYKQQSRAHLKDRRPKLANMLKEVGDFYLELKWDFQSWSE